MARALLSVADKTGIEEVARTLHHAGLEIVSTGGTLASIRATGTPVTPVEEVTRFPEMLDGRVKTLHPLIHAALLYRRDLSDHVQQARDHRIEPIDVLICNLYPFEQAISRAGVTEGEAIENIDIGGPAMIRAAAKNYRDVIVLTSPADYEHVTSQIASGGVEAITAHLRRELAVKAFDHTAAYDALIASWLGDDLFPQELVLSSRRVAQLRYGENPHQEAAAYVHPGPSGLHGIGGWSVLSHGELSFNNYLDASAAWSAVQEFDSSAAVIVKHNVPCGLAIADTTVEAFERALAGDPVSAFGGTIGINRTVSDVLAQIVARRKFDVILAPGFEPDALERLRTRRGLRIIDTSKARRPARLEYRTLPGGLLVQTADLTTPDPSTWKTVTERDPTPEELEQLRFAWIVVKHVKSNAIVLTRDNGTVGICGGQPNRVDSVRMAIQRAGERASGSVLASDAFFPFADGAEAALEAGVTAIVQPGGSTRDPETIEAANRAGAAMVFTGIRHFRH